MRIQVAHICDPRLPALNTQFPVFLPSALLSLVSKRSANLLLLSQRNRVTIPVGNLKGRSSTKEELDNLQGTLVLIGRM
jgi:hypothetical protein